MRIQLHVIRVKIYAYVCINIRVCAYKNAYIHTYAYTRLFISMYELAECVQNQFTVILVHRISAESTKKPICEQHPEYKPRQGVFYWPSHRR